MKNNLEKLKENYPIDSKIKLLEDMEEIQGIKSGQIGILESIDDEGSLHMRWENGSGLAIIPEVDKFEVIERPDKIKVIIIEPEKDPYIKEIYNTLKAKQEIVGGLIQCLPTMFSKEDSYDFIVNDEGKLLDLPLNRYIYDKQDIVAGNIIIAKADISTGEFVSIDDSQIDFLIKKIEEIMPKYNSIDLKKNMENEYDLEEMDK